MMRFKRADRVGGQVQKELSHLLQREIGDPRLDTVTIVHVSMTDDLRLARIYYTVGAGEEAKSGALAGFKSASKYLRRKLSHRLELKHMPELEFLYDESFERAARVNQVLREVIE
ncbi:MAG: 30S ribosome-binding factor RbfA [Deltaproteobacteria bacterium]|jgi:ribosome-binding factor A